VPPSFQTFKGRRGLIPSLDYVEGNSFKSEEKGGSLIPRKSEKGKKPRGLESLIGGMEGPKTFSGRGKKKKKKKKKKKTKTKKRKRKKKKKKKNHK